MADGRWETGEAREPHAKDAKGANGGQMFLPRWGVGIKVLQCYKALISMYLVMILRFVGVTKSVTKVLHFARTVTDARA